MKKIVSAIWLFSLVLPSVLLFSCRNNDAGQVDLPIVEKISSCSDALIGVVDSYSSGLINNGEPLKVRLVQGLQMSVRFGEELPRGLFKITPDINGHAFWIDKNTIGFKPDKSLKFNTAYNVSFNIGLLLDMPDDNILDFSFFVISQDYFVDNVELFCDGTEKCSYSFDLYFSNSADCATALSLLDKSFLRRYECVAKEVSPYVFRIYINDIQRKESDYQLDVCLDGDVLGAEHKEKISLTIPARDSFDLVYYNFDSGENVLSLYFSDLLSSSENAMYNVELSEKWIDKTFSVNENCLHIFFSYNFSNCDISILNGLKSKSGKNLKKGRVLKNLSHNPLNPGVRWTDDGVIVPNTEDATVSFEAKCLESVTLRIIRIYNNNVLSFIQSNGLSDTYGVRKVGRLIKKVTIPLVQDDYKKWHRYSIRLSDYIDLNSEDAYQINLDFDMTQYAFACDNEPVGKGYNSDYWDNESYDYRVYYYGNSNDPCRLSYYNYVDITKNIYISNLAVTVKSSESNYYDVFVRNVDDVEAVPGCEITIYDYQLQKIGEGKTDGAGFARVPFDKKPYCVVVRDKNGSNSYVLLDKNKSLSLSKFDVSGNYVKNNIDAFPYSNRDVWRPGDSIQLGLMVVDKDSVLAPNYPVVLELIDPNGRLYTKKANNIPVGKIYSFNVRTSVNDPTGTWNAHFKVGNEVFSKQIRVETVKPNRLKIDFEPMGLSSIVKGDKVKLSARRLNGSIEKGMRAEVFARLYPSHTAFKGFEEYCFDSDINDFDYVDKMIFNSALDDEGKADISLEAFKSVRAQGFMNAVFNVKVFEKDGGFSITSRSGKVSPYRRYVGVLMPEIESEWGDYYFTNKDNIFDIVVVNEDGTAAKDVKELYYEIYKLEHYWWWSENDVELSNYVYGGYYRPMRGNTLKVKNGRTSLAINVKDELWGSYLLVIKDKDGGHFFSKVINFDWEYGTRSSTVGQAPTIITLNLDKESYKVGETMHLSFPSNPNSKALITIENSSVVKVVHANDLGENASIDITVTEDMLPNSYVSVSLIQPFSNDNGMPVRMYGVKPFSVNDEESVLHPLVDAPGLISSNTTVDIKVSEQNGRAMYYTVAVVDEGLLNLTGYKTPDPHAYFFKKRALGVRTWDNYDDFVSAETGLMGGTKAVGGDAVPNMELVLLDRFQAVAVMMGPFELKAGETMTHHFDVSDYNGMLRVMVVASDGKRASGSAQGEITVRDNLMIVPTAPRVINPGDKAVVNATLIAPDMVGKKVDFELVLNNLKLLEPAPKKVVINADGEAVVPLKLMPGDAMDNAVLTMKASCDGNVVSRSVTMPIRIPLGNKYNMTQRELKGHESATIDIECQGFDGSIATKLVANTRLPINLFKHIDYISSYPFGCLEQFVSKAFPKLYLNYLITLDAKTKGDLKRDIDDVIANMNAYLRSDFSMTNWRNGSYSDPWTEIYALHFLVEAKNQGYNVSQSLIDNIVGYQRNKANAWNMDVDIPAMETVQAYRLFVLALNNTAEVKAMNKLKDLELKYPLTKSLLAAAYALIGKKNIAENMIPVIDYSAANWLSDYYVTYGSRLRDMSFCVYAQMLVEENDETVQGDIDEICNVLGSDRWIDTHSTALALFVLGKYAERLGVTSNDISLVIKDENKTYNVSSNNTSLSFDITPKKGINNIDVTNNSDNPVIITVFTKGKVAEYADKDEGRWYEMSVNYLDKDRNPVKLDNVKQNKDVFVEIVISNPHQYEVTDNALVYYAPSGFELINNRLYGDNRMNERNCKHIDYQDEHAEFFFDLAPNESKTFRLTMNAAYEGSYVVPSVTCEDMYNSDIYYRTAAGRCNIVK
ncbi:MAG: alpha-2-macroglobulin family protein [Candidatus Limimorpha sp.]